MSSDIEILIVRVKPQCNFNLTLDLSPTRCGNIFAAVWTGLFLQQPLLNAKQVERMVAASFYDLGALHVFETEGTVFFYFALLPDFIYQCLRCFHITLF